MPPFQILRSFLLRNILALAAFSLSFCLRFVQAEDISLNINVSAAGSLVSVKIANVGQSTVLGLGVTVELDGSNYGVQFPTELKSQQSVTTNFTVRMPTKFGSYPLYTTVSYQNDGRTLTLLNVGYFHHAGQNILTAFCNFPETHLRASAELPLQYDTSKSLRLFLPEEIEVEKSYHTTGGRNFVLKNTRPEYSTNYAVYAVLEDDSQSDLHSTVIYQSRLITTRFGVTTSYIPPTWYLISALLGLVLCAGMYAYYCHREQAPALLHVCLIRWSFGFFTVSALLYVFYSAHIIPEYIFAHFGSFTAAHNFILRELSPILELALKALYFEGTNYDYFSSYVAFPLWLYMLFGNFFTLFFLVKPNPATDRSWHLMLSLFSLFRHPLKPYWNSLSRHAILALLVKVYFLPMLASWAINNVIHQHNLGRIFVWNFENVCQYVIAFLILVDVLWFAVGYMVELPQLKNQIKSVEPTLFGWAICLMCYPPFNDISFLIFDQPLHDHWAPAGKIGAHFALALIMLLWAIYVWATIALGWKCSNLTNRGIVSSGPYRFVRHPAYVSKVLLWTVSGYFLADKNFFLILTLVFVYALRAWTEERHLSADPDYRAYAENVRYRFIPGLI